MATARAVRTSSSKTGTCVRTSFGAAMESTTMAEITAVTAQLIVVLASTRPLTAPHASLLSRCTTRLSASAPAVMVGTPTNMVSARRQSKIVREQLI